MNTTLTLLLSLLVAALGFLVCGVIVGGLVLYISSTGRRA